MCPKRTQLLHVFIGAMFLFLFAFSGSYVMAAEKTKTPEPKEKTFTDPSCKVMPKIIAKAGPTYIPITPTSAVSPSAVPTAPVIAKLAAVPVKPPSVDADKIFNLINAHRVGMGLTPFEKDPKLCALAVDRGPELSAEVASGDFHRALYDRNLPFWITEDMKYGADEQGTVDWWLSSSLHRHAIEGNYKYACGECYGNACIMLFTNWQPK